MKKSKVIKLFGDPRKIKRGIRDFQDNIAYVTRNRDDLREQYLGRWIAVYNQKVVAHSGDLNGLMRVLEDMKKVNKEITYVSRIPREDEEKRTIILYGKAAWDNINYLN